VLSTTFIIAIGIASFLTYSPRPIIATATAWGGPDFTYCCLFLKGWWDGTITNPYNYDQQRQLLEQVYGYQGTIIMPFPWSPISALLLYPLVSIKDTALAVSVWNLVTLSIFLGCVIAWIRQAGCNRYELGIRTLIGAMLATSTFTAQTLSLGQTSLLGAGGIGALLLATATQNTCASLLRAVTSTALMSLKPTYLLLALGTLIARRQWRVLFLCSTVLATLAILTVAIFTPGVCADWLQQVKFHSNPIDLRYRSIGTEYGYQQSAVVRNLLTLWLPSDIAHRVCSTAFLVCFLAITARSLIKRKTREPNSSFCLLATFLLVIPYLGFHDELLLFPAIVSGWQDTNSFNRRYRWVAIATIAILCYAPLLPLTRLATKFLLLVALYLLSLDTCDKEIAHEVHS